jgi:hypothetical protein
MDAEVEGRPVTEREQTIRLMLERFNEAQAQKKGEGGIGGQFSSAHLQWDETTWNSSYVELSRCLEKLRNDPVRSRVWWSVRQRYLHCQIRRREVAVKYNHRKTVRTPVSLPSNEEVVSRQTVLNGKTTMLMVRVWDPKVREDLVDEGVKWLAKEFRGKPRMPKEM